MVQLVLYIIPVFIVYLFIRRYWVSNETLKTKFKLARLRDELTWLAISDEIDQKDKGYVHLYNNIEKVLTALPRFNFWMVLYLLLRDKQPINIHEIERVRNEVDKNTTLSNIYDDYHKVIISYIARKNFLTVLVTFPLWKKLLDNRLSIVKDNPLKGSNKKGCIGSIEYSSFALYLQNISPKTLLAGC